MSQTAAEQVKDRLPITDVLSSYITLIPAGKQFKAKCPFHNERTASFSISPERNLYYCFGCGAKGDIFTFVQEFEGVDFNGAIKMLAERAGIELRSYDRRADDLGALYEFLEKATLRYQNELQRNSEALLYLKGRGINSETISSFRIGYAPEAWRFVADECRDEAERKIAERAGLIKKPDTEKEKEPQDGRHGYYDRFRGRIIFPLFDSSGRVVGYSGRAFPDTEEGPKYLNSPETEVFHKSRVLYGFDKAKFAIKKHNFAILVEGQMDLVTSHQMGFRNTVATSGTAVSEQSAEDTKANLSVLSRLTPHIFLAFDGDPAGQKALSRAALVALMLGMNPKVVPVPEGIDPAEFLLKNGAEKWKELIKDSQHFIIYKSQKIKMAGHSPHVLVRSLREEVFPYLSKVVSPIEQKLYTEAVAKELGISHVDATRELALYVGGQPALERVEKINENSFSDLDPTALERFTAFVLRFPEDQILSVKNRIGKLSFDDRIIGQMDIAEDRVAFATASIERDYSALDEIERVAVAEELGQKVIEKFLNDIQKELSAKLIEAEKKGDEEATGALLSQLAALNKRRHE